MKFAIVWAGILSFYSMMQTPQTPACAATATEVVAQHVSHGIRLDAANPAKEWQKAAPARFCSDWQGKHGDPALTTEVQMLWTPQTLYLRFEARYRDLYVFTDSEANGRRDYLWERDVAEAFLQPDASRPDHYREFEISPNGMWLDLDIVPDGKTDLKSGLERSVFVDEGAKSWSAELAIPMRALTPVFDPSVVWRANFYRVEGRSEPRTYLAWQATGTPQPNFHVPGAFGKVRFEGS